MKKNKNWIIGGFVGYLLLPLMLIIGIIIGVYLPENFSLSQDNLSSIISAVATFIIAILTIVLAKETWELRQIQLEEIEKIRKAGVRPSVALFFSISPVSFHLMNLHIINSGAGSAFDIKFTVENNGNDNGYNFIKAKMDTISMVKNGISSLFPNENRKSFLFGYLNLDKTTTFDDIIASKFKITITFTDLEKKEYTESSIIDLSEYNGIHYVGDQSDPLYQISDHLKKIEKNINNIASNTKK